MVRHLATAKRISIPVNRVTLACRVHTVIADYKTVEVYDWAALNSGTNTRPIIRTCPEERRLLSQAFHLKFRFFSSTFSDLVIECCKRVPALTIFPMCRFPRTPNTCTISPCKCCRVPFPIRLTCVAYHRRMRRVRLRWWKRNCRRRMPFIRNGKVAAASRSIKVSTMSVPKVCFKQNVKSQSLCVCVSNGDWTFFLQIHKWSHWPDQAVSCRRHDSSHLHEKRASTVMAVVWATILCTRNTLSLLKIHRKRAGEIHRRCRVTRNILVIPVLKAPLALKIM